MAQLRMEVVSSGGAQAEPKRIFEKVLDGDILGHIRKRDWQGLEALLRTILPSTINVPALVECAEKG